MSFAVFVIEVFVSLSLSGFLLYSYGNIAKQNPFVTLCCLLVWFFSFIVVFLLPLDISSSFSNRCINSNISNRTCHLSFSYISPEPIRIIWYILYWSLQLLSWVVLPIFQSFVSIHYFSISKRIAWALVQNGIIFLSLALISLIIMLFLIIKEGWNFHNIISMAVTASNVWVLFFLILLLGYGLVEVPRFLFKIASYKSYLKYLYYQTAKTYFEKLEAEIEMDEVVKELNNVSQNLNMNDTKMKNVRIIITKLPSFIQSQIKQNADISNDFTLKTENIPLNRLEKLHEKTIRTARKLLQNTVYLSQLVSKTISLEILVNRIGNKKWMVKENNSFVSSKTYHLLLDRINWVWKIYILRVFYIFFFVCSLFLSLVIFISEITIFLNQFAKITLLSYFINVSYLTNEYLTSEVFSIIILGYIALCSYYSVFQIRIFNKYRLAPQHNSNEFSLIFSAILLSRLITSMCLNFLYMVDLARLPSTSVRNKNDIKPTFFDIWGSTVPEIAVFFFIYFPLVIIFVVVSTIFHLDKRILSFFGFQQFIGDADLTSELVLEGMEYIKLERKLLSKSEKVQKNKSEFDIHQKFKRESMISINYDGAHSKGPSFGGDIISNFISILPQRNKVSAHVKYRPLKSNNPDEFSDSITIHECTLSDPKCDVSNPVSNNKEIFISSGNISNSVTSSIDVPNREIFWDI